jgi:hypothetical protein
VDNNKTVPGERKRECVNWILPSKDRIQQPTSVNTVMHGYSNCWSRHLRGSLPTQKGDAKFSKIISNMVVSSLGKSVRFNRRDLGECSSSWLAVS